MLKRFGTMLAVLFGCLLCLGAQAEDAENPAVRRALLIGCDQFVSHESLSPSASLNVQRMEDLLLSDIRDYELIVSVEHGIGSVQDLRDIMQAVFSDADENDISLVYFCTHGLYDRVSYQALLVLSDGITEENLTAASLRDALDTIAGQKVLLLDACSSGAFIGKGAWDEALGNSFQSPDYRVLTSAGADENSFLWHGMDGSSGGSYFAQFLCEGLNSREFDCNADGAVTLCEARQGLLECHGASTAQCYPQESDFVLYAYDPDAEKTDDSPIDSITLESSVLTDDEDTLYFSFTARRSVRVQYLLIYYKNGHWRFDAPQMIEDPENASGALKPGRKERSITLATDDDDPYGYALLLMVSQEGRRSMLVGSRLISVQRDTGDPKLSISCADTFSPSVGEELGILVSHLFPCSLTVTVHNAQGETVRRLAYKESSRPLNLEGEASLFYWNGKNAAGETVPDGVYTLEASCTIGSEKYSVTSEKVYVKGS